MTSGDWVVVEGRGYCTIRTGRMEDKTGSVICDMRVIDGYTNPDIAHHIVKCVNSHERLVAMLREIPEAEDDGLFEMLGDDYCQRLNALLEELGEL